MLDLEVPTATLASMGEFGEEFYQLNEKLTKAINLAMDSRTDDRVKRLFNLRGSYITVQTYKRKSKGASSCGSFMIRTRWIPTPESCSEFRTSSG
eukprot:9113684-Heterocapsa_arctica.AAC.1